MRIAFLIVSAAALAGCASTGPRPCTVEWIELKKDVVFERFAQENQEQIASLLTVGLKLSGDGAPKGQAALLEAAGGLMVAGSLVKAFAETAAPEINNVVQRCGGPEKSSKLFADFLRHEGVNDSTVRAIERLGVLERL